MVTTVKKVVAEVITPTSIAASASVRKVAAEVITPTSIAPAASVRKVVVEIITPAPSANVTLQLSGAKGTSATHAPKAAAKIATAHAYGQGTAHGATLKHRVVATGQRATGGVKPVGVAAKHALPAVEDIAKVGSVAVVKGVAATLSGDKATSHVGTLSPHIGGDKTFSLSGVAVATTARTPSVETTAGKTIKLQGVKGVARIGALVPRHTMAASHTSATGAAHAPKVLYANKFVGNKEISRVGVLSTRHKNSPQESASISKVGGVLPRTAATARLVGNKAHGTYGALPSKSAYVRALSAVDASGHGGHLGRASVFSLAGVKAVGVARAVTPINRLTPARGAARAAKPNPKAALNLHGHAAATRAAALAIGPLNGPQYLSLLRPGAVLSTSGTVNAISIPQRIAVLSTPTVQDSFSLDTPVAIVTIMRSNDILAITP